ncbi:MAG: hypothetical protein J6Y02_20980 [Pseudobutyrivibrio sp.]|nr:hypothetical protein [Pseudobutyrivibrio sp.]
MRLIDGDALKAEFAEECAGECGVCSYHKWENYTSLNPVSHCLLIDNAPTVENITVFCENADEKAIADMKEELQKVIDDSRSQGKWIFHKDYNESCRYGCNQCGNLTNIPGNFCPNCGAMMQKGGAEND